MIYNSAEILKILIKMCHKALGLARSCVKSHYGHTNSVHAHNQCNLVMFDRAGNSS